MGAATPSSGLSLRVLSSGGSPLARILTRYKRRHAYGLSLLLCFVALVASVVLVGAFGSYGDSGNMIWISNGLLLAYLLLAPRWRWLAYLSVGFLGMLVGSVLIHEPWRTNLGFNLLDLIEILVPAYLLRQRSNQLPRFTHGPYLVRFLTFAAITGPLITGLIYAGYESLGGQGFVQVLIGWIAADGLGTAIACPVFVAVLLTHFRSANTWRKGWPSLVLMACVTLIIFSHARAPVLFLIYPALILVLLRLGLAWAASSAMFVAFVACRYTLHGEGPMAASTFLTLSQQCLLLQVLVATGVFMLFGISVVLDSRRSIELRLAKIASLHALVTENSRDVILISDFKGVPYYISPTVVDMIGWTAEEVSAFGFAEVAHPDDLPGIQQVVQSLDFGGKNAAIEFRVRHRDGGYRWIESSIRIIHAPEMGVSTGILHMIRDVNERKLAQATQSFDHSLKRAVIGASLDGVVVLDRLGQVVSFNQRFCEIWKDPYAVDPVVLFENGQATSALPPMTRFVAMLKDPETVLRRVQELDADPDLIDECQIELVDGRTLERYSTSIRSDEGEYFGRVWFFRDITERKLAEKKLLEAYETVEALAATDPLTGLANRRRFDSALTSEWRRGLRDRRPLSLLMIDADLFKSFNDTYGHPRGDNCLKQIAEAAQDVVARPGDVVARYGGEEFAIILPSTDHAGAMQLANEICEAMRGRKLPHEKNALGIVTLSIGCATMVPAFGRHAANLVELADQALYEAKHRGRNQVCDATVLEKPVVAAAAEVGRAGGSLAGKLA